MVVVVVDKLSSTAVDFIRSERELKKLCLYGFWKVLCTCSKPPRRCEGKWALLKLWGQLQLLEEVLELLILLLLLLLLTCLIKLRPGVLIKTLSHMWGKLNLPMLLFKVGLLTLINIDSLLFVATLCPSLPIIWKLLWLVGWPVWLLWWWIGEGSFRCSLYLWPKVREVPLCIHHHNLGHHIGTSIWHHFGWP